MVNFLFSAHGEEDNSGSLFRVLEMPSVGSPAPRPLSERVRSWAEISCCYSGGSLVNFAGNQGGFFPLCVAARGMNYSRWLPAYRMKLTHRHLDAEDKAAERPSSFDRP